MKISGSKKHGRVKQGSTWKVYPIAEDAMAEIYFGLPSVIAIDCVTRKLRKEKHSN